MTNEKKILFLDLDGTLLNDEKKITEGNAEAIRRALVEGHKIVINTGRASSSALRLAGELGLNMEGCYAITYNGACIYDLALKKPVYRVAIPMEHARYTMSLAKELGIHSHTYSEQCVVSETDNPDLQQYLAYTSMTADIVPDPCDYLAEDPCKVLIVDYKKTGALETYVERIKDWAPGKVDYFYSCEELLEIVSPGVSKGNAIRILCKLLDIPLENTVSAGDADNDIPMITTTKIGVVMKNAAPHMRQYGNYVTEHDNNHDGIREIIEKFIL
ncbi:MAG: HAD family phosphatase [Clostridiales bacterium]|nr:HAD family phosphatase [Candidatus Blautia equi]